MLATFFAPNYSYSLEIPTERNPGAKNSQTAAFGNATNPQVIDDIVLESLYRSGLYTVAVEHCERELRRSGLSRLSTSQWTARLITSVALRDSVALTPEFVTISSRLQNATLLAKPAIDLPAQDIHSLWVRFSLANATYRVIEREMATFLAAPANLARRDDCLNSIRKLSDSLVSFRDEVQSAQGIFSRGISSRGVVSRGAQSRTDARDAANQVLDLASLRNNILLLQIDLILQRGRLFDPGSDDAIAAGADATAAIEQAMNATEEQWKGRPSLELAQWDAALMIGKHQNVQEGIRFWIARHSTHELLPKAIAIALQSCIAMQDMASGDEWLAFARERFSTSQPPELAIARLEWSLLKWRAARSSDKQSDKESNDAALELILKQRDQIASTFGAYWGLRAEATILKSESTGRSKVSSSSDKIANRESMSMIRLQLKQLLAANRIDEAIDRLRQSESIAAKNNDMEQAFELAKLQIGLLVKRNTTEQLQNQESQSARLVETAQQIEATSKTYSGLTGAAELNQFAESLLLNAWKAEADATEKNRLWKRYEQHCTEHLDQWPLSISSQTVRQQLSASYLASGQLEFNLQLWSKTPKEVDERNEQFVNALLLFVSINNPKEIAKQWRTEVSGLSPRWQQACRWLLADWAWWTLDGGVDRLDVSADVSADFSGEVLNIDSIAAFLQDTSGTKSSMQSQSLDANTLGLCEWIEKDPANRIGFAMATGACYLAFIDDRFAFNKTPLTDSDRSSLISTLNRLKSVMIKIETDKNKPMHPSVLQACQDVNVSLTARIEAISIEAISGEAIDVAPSTPKRDLGGDLIDRQRKSPRSAKWLQELAIVQLWRAKSDPANRDAMIDKAIQTFLKLASGNPVGSEGWFGARLRLSQCYLLLSKEKQAHETVSLTTAMAGQISHVWQKRLPGL